MTSDTNIPDVAKYGDDLLARIDELTVDVPELPPHIAKEWEIASVGSPKTGDKYLMNDKIGTANRDHPWWWLSYILRRREPEWEVPECLKMSGFNRLRYTAVGWKLIHNDCGMYDFEYFFPNLTPPPNKEKVYTW